jgi:hypothetical protein
MSFAWIDVIKFVLYFNMMTRGTGRRTQAQALEPGDTGTGSRACAPGRRAHALQPGSASTCTRSASTRNASTLQPVHRVGEHMHVHRVGEHMHTQHSAARAPGRRAHARAAQARCSPCTGSVSTCAARAPGRRAHAHAAQAQCSPCTGSASTCTRSASTVQPLHWVGEHMHTQRKHTAARAPGRRAHAHAAQAHCSPCTGSAGTCTLQPVHRHTASAYQKG